MSEHDHEPALAELADLPATAAPPPGLEDRVVRAVAAAGLLRPPRRQVSPWLALAASLVAAVGGWLAHGLATTTAGARPDAPAFLLLLSEPQPLATDKPVAALADEYRRWAAGLAEANGVVYAARLLDAGRELGATGGSAAPPKGFFVVRAADLDAAVEVARTSPHLAYGGAITVRPVAPPAPSPTP
jgi:hypothetical protein